MLIDRYTKAVLTLIALCLVMPLPSAQASAQEGVEGVHSHGEVQVTS